MYYLVYFIGLITSPENKNKLFFTYLFSFIIILLASLRYGVGPDYFNYQYTFNSIEISNLDYLFSSGGNEILFKLIIYFFKTLGFGYDFFNFSLALVSIIFLTKSYIRHSFNPTFSLWIFFCSFYFVWIMSGVRQGLALSIGTYYFLNFFHAKKPVKLIIVTLLLSLIHASAIIYIPMYYFSRLKIRYINALFLISIIISFFNVFDLINLFDYGYLISRIVFYEDYFNLETVKIFDFKTISRFIILLGIIVLFKLPKTDDKENIISSNLYKPFLLSYCIYFVFKFSEVTAANLSMYGFVFLTFLIPNLLSKLKKQYKLISNLIFILFFTLFFLKSIDYMWHASNENMPNRLYIPYNSILE